MLHSMRSAAFGAGLSVLAALMTASVAQAQTFSTSITNPTPVPASGIIAGNYPAGQSDASLYFAIDLKAGALATQISVGGTGSYKALDLVLLDAGGRKLDGYHTTAGEGGNSQATRVFPIDAGGRYVIRLNTKGPESTTFQVALGGSAFANRAAAAEQSGNSQSFLRPTPIGTEGVVTGAFPAGSNVTYYYFATDLKAGSLLTQMSVNGRQGASKWVQLTLLDDKGRAADSYHMSRVEQNADATKSFAVDRSGRHVLRVTVQGAEGTKFRVELGGSSFAGGR
jgi:hypothetical protein